LDDVSFTRIVAGKAVGTVTDRFHTLVKSATTDPIQLRDFRPFACESLARLGSPNDGGYVVPLGAVTAADALLSFGLSHDWKFERDFKKHNRTAAVHCYDHTVSALSAFQYSIGRLARFFLRYRLDDLRRSFAFLDYPLFFRGDKIHFRQRIWYDRQDDSATIDDAFARLPAGSQIFVKMDIEGSEYRVLDDLLRHASDVVALAIEFHDIDILPEKFNSLIEKIKRDFYIVHVHGNNLGGLAPFHFPIALELTFFSKRFFKSAPSPSALSYPVPGLDSPNYPRFPDFKLEF
jgi:hypothetical protein